MSRMKRLLAAPARLASAVRREGAGPVVSFMFTTVRRRGAWDTVRLGFADRATREQAAEADIASASTAPARTRSRALHAASAPFRLVRAMRAHGAGPVMSFLVITVRRRGAVGALRLGLTDRTRRETVQEDSLAGAAPPIVRRKEPRDLDEDYGLDSGSWLQCGQFVGAAATSADIYDDTFADAVVSFVIRAEVGADGKALARTREAIRRLPAGAPASEGRGGGDHWVVFLRSGDIPSAELPRELARATRRGVAEVVTFDLLRRDGGRVFPVLAPGANPTLLAAVDYTFGRFALRRAIVPVGVDLATVDPRSLVLDWMAAQPPLQARGRWRHVGRPVVEANLSRQDIDAARLEVLTAARRRIYPRPVEAVSVIICTRDKGHLTRQLVRSLLSRPSEEVAEVVVVANGTANPYALATLEDVGREPRVKVLWRDEPFNFSRLCNAAVAETRGPGPLLFLNDDLAPVSEDWIAALMAHLASPAIGVVGPLLLYPDERVQHAGMYLGFNGRAGHTLRGARLPEQDYLFTAAAPREVSCVTGAVMLVRREAFEAVGGFDDQLATYLQDVDLCLRLGRSGWLNVFEPASVLIHMESASIRELDRTTAFHRQREAEDQRFTQRWGAALSRDPHHPVGFDIQDEALRRLAGPAVAQA